eukprot:s304_g53.t1
MFCQGSLRLLRKLDSGFGFRQALYKCKGGNSALVELQSVGILPHSWILCLSLRTNLFGAFISHISPPFFTCSSLFPIQ